MDNYLALNSSSISMEKLGMHTYKMNLSNEFFFKNGRAEQDGYTTDILFVENNMDLQHHQGIPIRLPAINWEERL